MPTLVIETLAVLRAATAASTDMPRAVSAAGRAQRT